MPSIKATCAELNSFANKLNTNVSGLIHTGQFDGQSIAPLFVSQIITGSLGTSPKGVPPVDELIAFVQGRADALSGQLIPHQSKPEHKSEHQDDHQQGSSAFNLRYQPQCTLCMDERHPLYVCLSFKVER